MKHKRQSLHKKVLRTMYTQLTSHLVRSPFGLIYQSLMLYICPNTLTQFDLVRINLTRLMRLSLDQMSLSQFSLVQFGLVWFSLIQVQFSLVQFCIVQSSLVQSSIAFLFTRNYWAFELSSSQYNVTETGSSLMTEVTSF